MMSEQPDTKFPLATPSIDENRIEELKQLFPEAFNEGKIDFERLRLTLGDAVDEGRERYDLSWTGKADAKHAIRTPTTATLRPSPEESVNFDDSENLVIEGDNLEVLKLLQKSYHGKVKMIYIDPPYNTGKDFIYPDNYQDGIGEYLRLTGQVDEEGVKVTTNPETSGRKHSNWLSMMYPRLFLARNLLREDGAIFVSIDDHEVHNLRHVMDEIFGEENFVAELIWNTQGHTDNQYDIKVNHEYVIVFSKNRAQLALGYIVDPNTPEGSNLWSNVAVNSITKNGSSNPPSTVELPIGFPCEVGAFDLAPTELQNGFNEALKQQGYISRTLTRDYGLTYPIRYDRMVAQSSRLTQPCRVLSGWANIEKLKEFIRGGCEPLNEEDGATLRFFLSKKGVIYYRREKRASRHILSVLRNMGTTETMRSELETWGIRISYPKPRALMQYLVQVGGNEDNMIVLDFFAGSGTTADAVLRLNREEGGDRRFILVQLPEPTKHDDYPTISEITKARVRKVIENLSEEEDQPSLDLDGEETREAEDLGFKVFKLDASNFKVWDGDTASEEDALAEQLNHHTNPLVPERSTQDLLYEILLKSGYPLTVSINTVEVAGADVFSVAGGELLVSLGENLNREMLQEMIRLKPRMVVCMDRAFDGDDPLKTNVVLEMKSHEIEFRTV